MADPVRLCLLGVTGNETEPESDQQQQKERNGQSDAQGQSAHCPDAGSPVFVDIEKPGKQASDNAQQQQNHQYLDHR
jgi:hypothetical protein